MTDIRALQDEITIDPSNLGYLSVTTDDMAWTVFNKLRAPQIQKPQMVDVDVKGLSIRLDALEAQLQYIRALLEKPVQVEVPVQDKTRIEELNMSISFDDVVTALARLGVTLKAESEAKVAL